MPHNDDFEELLREMESRRFSRQHTERTPKCLHPSLYVRYARTGWPNEVVAHAKACAYCQKSKAAAWSVECPGLGELQAYLQNPDYPDSVAVDRHLYWDWCGACAARIRILQRPQLGIKNTTGWITLVANLDARTPPHQHTKKPESENYSSLPNVIGGPRPTIVVHGKHDLPSVDLRIEEHGNDTLVVRLITKESSLACKTLDLRLAGERFETRCELTFRRTHTGEWLAESVVKSSEERMGDLSERCIISFRICDEIDQVREGPPAQINITRPDVSPREATSSKRGFGVIVLRSAKKSPKSQARTFAAAAHARTEPGWPIEVEVTPANGVAPVRLRFYLTARNIAVELADSSEGRSIRLAARKIPMDAIQVTAHRQVIAPEGLFKLHSQSTEAEITQALLDAGLEVQAE